MAHTHTHKSKPMTNKLVSVHHNTTHNLPDMLSTTDDDWRSEETVTTSHNVFHTTSYYFFLEFINN